MEATLKEYNSSCVNTERAMLPGILSTLLMCVSLVFIKPAVASDISSKYHITKSENGLILFFQGDIDFGSTRDMRDMLRRNPQVRAVVFNSDGGSIYEGRGLAKLMLENQLDTYTTTSCSSACITAFTGGHKRWIAEGAKLGFHQYRLEANYILPHLDIALEFKKDFEFYKTRGINVSYIQRARDTQHNDIWFPDYKILRAARVIHGIAKPSIKYPVLVVRDMHL